MINDINTKMNIKEIKDSIKGYNLVSKINNLEDNDLKKLLENIKKYNKERINYDYRNYKFKEKIVTVNDEQYDIITADMDVNIRIVACAGSGKTTTIVCRIKYLIDKGVNPKNIMLTTFNVDASHTLKKRIEELFGFMPCITIGTIDSIACKFYHKYFKKNYYIGISEYTTELLNYLKSEKGEIILNEYKYIFFDEFQDISDIQFEIVKKFYNNGTYITVIGDDAQNIYQWRGSNIDFILNFDKYFEKITTYKLVNNYRSTPEIIDFANNSIIKNTDQIPKEMKANIKSINFKPYIKRYKHINHQNNEIIKRVLYFMKNGISLDKIAVISRNNYPLKLLEEAIEKYNNNNSQQINYVALITDQNIDAKPKIKEDHLTLTTIFKSKGLEWKVVFLIGCNDKFFPSETDSISLQEERRLFYVAVTRPQQYLFIMFTENSISRFISEIPSQYYQFEDFYTKYFDYKDDRNQKYDNEVTKLIQLIQEKDMEYLRVMNIIPKVNPISKKIYEGYEFSNKISQYYLHADFGEYIDRYISRLINEKKNKKNDDRSAILVIGSVGLNADEWEIYKKYQPNFKINMKNIDANEIKQEDYIELISKNTNTKNFIGKIENKDARMVKEIIGKIKDNSIKRKIDVNEAVVFQNNYIPPDFKQKVSTSYIKYTNNKLRTNTIKEDIYNISLCGNIMNDRRRLMYRNMFDEFTEDYKEMFNNIDKYVESIKDNDLKAKRILRSSDYDIIGEADLIDITNKKIIDFKCSASEDCKLEWIIQLLMYVALVRNANKDKIIIIETIEIFNPLKGMLFTIDITDWDKDKELLEYIYKLRNICMSRNKVAVSTKVSIIDGMNIINGIKDICPKYNENDNLFEDFV